MTSVSDRIAEARRRIAELDREVQEERATRNVECESDDVVVSRIAEVLGAPPAGDFAFSAVRKLTGHFGKVYAQNWAGDSVRMVSASQDGKLIDWNALTESKVHMISLKSAWVMTCGFDQSASPRLVASGGLDNVCTVFDVTADIPTINAASLELTGHDGYLSCCRFIDSSIIITSSGDSTCGMWNTESGRLISRFADHSGDVMGVSPDPTNEHIFVSGSVDTMARLWDTRAKRSVAAFKGHQSDINSVDFFRSGLAFATASDDNSVRIFDIRAQAQVAVFQGKDVRHPAACVAVSKSGRLVFAGYEDSKARVWDTLSSKSEFKSLEHDSVAASGGAGDDARRISCVGVNKAGQAVCTGSWDKELRIWAQSLR